MSEVKKLNNSKEVIAFLTEKYPLCFSLKGEAKPLKIGIFHDLSLDLEDNNDLSKTKLRRAIRQYTSNWRYLHGVKEGVQRVNLQGNACGEIDKTHAEHALQQLQEAKAKIIPKHAVAKNNVGAKNHAATKNGDNKKNAGNIKASDGSKVNSSNKNKTKVVKKAGKQTMTTRLNNTTDNVRKTNQSAPNAKSLLIDDFVKGKNVQVKFGSSKQKGIILNIAKDIARVELETGMIVNVNREQLYYL